MEYTKQLEGHKGLALIRNFNYTSANFFLSVFFLSFCLFGAAPMAYGGSQASGVIGAIAAVYATATATQDLS